MSSELQKENAELREQNARLTEINQSLEAKTRELEQERQRLQGRVDLLLQKLFGRRSERFEDPNQKPLFDDVEALSAEARAEIESAFDEEEEEPPKRSRRNGRRRLPKDLPRMRTVLDIPDEEKRCPHGGTWEKFGEDSTEELDYIPAQFSILETVRPKYRIRGCDHPECQGVKMALLPPRPIEQGRPAPGLLAQIAVSKYSDHQPLYRQEQIFKRHSVVIPRSTMCGWMMTLGTMLFVVYLSMKEWLLKQRYLQADETTIRVQGMKTGKMHTGYFWGYGIPWAEVVYEFTLDRSHQRPLKFLEQFTGHLLQADGYDGYNEIIRQKDSQVVRLGCWAHVRRKFHDALQESPEKAKIILAAIQKLYRIEREIKGLDPGGRAAVRHERARPILDDLKPLLKAYQTEVLPQSQLGKAISYALDEWAHLEVYIEHGIAEIDNNSIENTFRPVAIGRKNFLFVGSPQGGQAAAVLYSLITSCKRLGVNPWEYLSDVIARLATHPMNRIWELTPRGWKETRERAAVEPDAAPSVQI
jgi:transposase